MPRQKTPGMKQTMIWLGPEDWEALEYIKSQDGLQSNVDAIRMALRQRARQLRAEGHRRRPPKPGAPAAEGEGA